VASLQKSALGITDFNDHFIQQSSKDQNIRRSMEVSGRNYGSPQRSVNLRGSADMNMMKSSENYQLEENSIAPTPSKYPTPIRSRANQASPTQL
jgi:hypothetical protein